jgi:hypothetical protein
MKTITKILILALCILVSLSSCAFFKSLVNDVAAETERVAHFAEDFAGLVENPTVENAQDLIHPSSPITAETVISKIENNEKLNNLDPTAEIQVGEIKNVNVSYHDEKLGGNLYTAECDIIVGDVTITVHLELLSTDESFGLYDFDIK